MKIKPMNYGERTTGYLLAQGSLAEYNYYVITLGTHPCAYVTVPKSHPLHMKLDDLEAYIDCHGGITFDGRHERFGIMEYCIGWDYAHYGDWVGEFGRDEEDTKYTTEELIAECMYVIGQLNMNKYLYKEYEINKVLSKDKVRELIADLEEFLGDSDS